MGTSADSDTRASTGVGTAVGDDDGVGSGTCGTVEGGGDGVRVWLPQADSNNTIK